MTIPILDLGVSREKFRQAVSELESAQKSYASVWRLRFASHPTLLVDVLSGSPEPGLTLYLNMQDWDFMPPVAAYLSPDLIRFLSAREIPESADDPSNPARHIVDNRQGRAWPCSPGFLQYHLMYPEDSWQLIRGGSSGTITWIVERACNMVDRRNLRGPAV